MAVWDWRGPGDGQSGLTVYQLQQLVSTGRVRADDEVRVDGGEWVRLADEPSLARFLPSAPQSSATRTIEVNGVVLELDEEGRPLPPSPEVVARMLSQGSDSEARRVRVARLRKILVGVSVAMIVGIAFLLVRILLGPGAR